MSSQRGNVKKSRPQKHQNKTAWKNVYHDTSDRTKKIVNTEVSGVCKRCKEVIDWKIKYKKYKPLTQPKTCVKCKEKTVKQAYHVYCQNCSKVFDVCAKCGDKKEIILEPSLSEAEQASQDRQLQFELETLPERKRRTFLRLQAQGKLTSEAMDRLEGSEGFNFFDEDEEDSDNNDCDSDLELDCKKVSFSDPDLKSEETIHTLQKGVSEKLALKDSDSHQVS